MRMVFDVKLLKLAIPVRQYKTQQPSPDTNVFPGHSCVAQEKPQSCTSAKIERTAPGACILY